MVVVAQLVRALGCGPSGWEFKSPRPPQKRVELKTLQEIEVLFSFFNSLFSISMMSSKMIFFVIM